MSRLTNYVAYVDPSTGTHRVGHYDLDHSTIQPLSFTSGTPVANIYQVIAAGDPSKIIASGSIGSSNGEGETALPTSLPVSSVRLLPPLAGRDVLAVGKNYLDHAKEFNKSGFAASDKVDLPNHPVIFTKRATSIVADGDEVLTHPEFTQSPDYEGEIGVIVGKPGFRITEADAWNHVWGFTIVNDLTARERQRDHKQFYIGKSPDTFCPMGPIAVPKEDLQQPLRVQTRVNGELRQDATLDDLIFSIPVLLRTMSEAQTLQPGDVLATGTPAGVAIGRTPSVFLQPGDEIVVSVNGLGSLKNRMVSSRSTSEKISPQTSVSSPNPFYALTNGAASFNGTTDLTFLNNKPLHYRAVGEGIDYIVFVHGLGGSIEFWTPLIAQLGLENSHKLHLFDFEGHGLSPTHPLSVLSIQSLSSDTTAVLKHAGASSSSPATLVAHSMGCLVAMHCALSNPSLIKKLILVGPPPSPLPAAASKGTYARAATVRAKGMGAVVDAVAGNGTSARSKKDNPQGVAAARISLLGTDPESYAKACMALAGSVDLSLGVEKLAMPTLIITGDEDKVSPPALCETYASRIGAAEKPVVLKEVGHWHVFEDTRSVANAVGKFL